MVRPVIFQVAGYQNSGKTTVTAKLIDSLTKDGIKTVAIKHHGHGGRPDSAAQKDSEKHLAAGALVSIVEGDGRLILQAENYESSLEEQIALLGFFHPDVILIEGYKQMTYPKLLLLRNDDDLPLINMVKNISVIMYWKEEMKGHIKALIDVPCFLIHEVTAINWTSQLLQRLVHNIDEKR